MSAGSTAPLRQIPFGSIAVDLVAANGATYVRPRGTLPPYPARLTDPLEQVAATAPGRVFMAERGPDGAWQAITYAQTLTRVRAIASALIARGLSAERPLVILSGNSVAHALLGLGAAYAGVPYCPVSPAYARLSQDFGKLRYAIALLTPGLVYADDGEGYGRAIAAAVPGDAELVVSRGAPPRGATAFEALLATADHPALAARRDAVGPDTIAKFLLTSGSTGQPKAVINTHRMLCANQVMLRETLAVLKAEPPVIVDWLPWNHTFGGNHNVGLTLFNGGTLYLDDGRPVAGAFDATVRNLMEVAPTIYFNVPKGYEMLVPHLRQNAALRRTFFSRLQCMFFAGAALSAHIWSALDEMAAAETGTRLPMLTGLGATETAPFCMSVTPQTSRAGHVGLPVAGNEIKLVPADGKLEVRVRGANVTPGYWRQPDLTAAAFDEEGFYRLGDALRPVDPDDFHKGFDFDGRLSEDFKLSSGTWVSCGPLRARLIAACAPIVRDVVLAAPNRPELGALVVLDPDGCHAACPHLKGVADAAAPARDPMLRRLLRERLAAFNRAATGSSMRVARALIVDGPLSIDKGEITDKGSINQRAVLEHRAALVEALYAPAPPAFVITLDQEALSA